MKGPTNHPVEETPPQPPRLKSVDLSLGTTKQIQWTIVVG